MSRLIRSTDVQFHLDDAARYLADLELRAGDKPGVPAALEQGRHIAELRAAIRALHKAVTLTHQRVAQFHEGGDGG
jgi:hypothetical protein